MTERFEIRLTPARRQELSALAADVGMSASDLARLAIQRLLNSRDTLLPPPPSSQSRATP
jgi:hypothetical protein